MAEFTEELKTDEWEVETPSGWQSFSGIGKTVKYKVWIVTTSTHQLKCADDHIVYSCTGNDYYDIKEIYAKNLVVGDLLLCENGLEKILSVEETDEYEEMYDLLDVSGGNVYYTNGVLSHNSTTIISYLLHYILFNQNMSVAVLANKQSTARDILSRLKMTYEYLPLWLQQGIKEWNKGSIELENGSRIIASSTSASAIRGGAYNCIFLDEFAYIPTGIAEQFFSSVYPTITSGRTTKVFMVSTPNGLNMFYHYWRGANKKDGEVGKNEYIPVDVHWTQIPKYPGGPLRDAEWKAQQIANTSEQQFQTEVECDFIGSSNTLISGSKLKEMAWISPTRSNNEGLIVYEEAKEKGFYFIVADTARGLGQDYSAAVVVDATQFPYKVVAKFRNNTISPLLFPTIISSLGRQYNNAWLLIELNDIGTQVADILHEDITYENMLMTSTMGRKGQVLSSGFGGSKSLFGVKTTRQSKRIGCSVLKNLVEEDKLIIEDLDIIDELTTFIGKHNSYEADDGHNDDLVMCLVLFSWMTRQQYFRDLTNSDVRERMYREKMDQLEEETLPFGFISMDDQDDDGVFLDGTDRWYNDTKLDEKQKDFGFFD